MRTGIIFLRLGVLLGPAVFLLDPARGVSADELAAPQSRHAVEALGLFHRVRATEEHVYGFSIGLWRDSGEVFGLFSHYEGPPEPVYRGIIRPVELGDSGELSFSLSGSYLRYSFSGTLSGNELEGTLESSWIGREDLPSTTEQVSLARNPKGYQATPESYHQWLRKWEKILGVAGAQ